MTITRGQLSTLASVGSAATLTTTWGTNPAAGSTILVFVQYAGTITSVVDNGTTPATFTLDKGTNSGKGAYIYRANNITLPGGGSYAVTVTVATAGTIGIAGVEYAGVKAGSPDATNSGFGSGTSVTTNSASPAASGGLVFGGFSDGSGLNPETVTFTGASPQAEQFRVTNGSSFWPCAVADALTGAAQAFTWTLGDSVSWGTVVAAYSPDTGGGGGGGGGGSATNPTWDTGGAWTIIKDWEFAGTTLPPEWQPGWFGASGITPGVNTVSPKNNSANVSVSGGTLNLTLGQVGGTVYGALVSSNPGNSATATGFQTGPPAAFEARINVPGPDGSVLVPNWCAWWTDGQSWPADGEIDILESLGTPDWNSAHVHDNATDGPGGGGAPGITHNQSPPYGWHTFGAYWKTPAANSVEFFYDGVSIGSLATDGFTSPQYLILVNTFNSAADLVPTTMQVDWVRVWTPGSTGRSVNAGAATAAGQAPAPSAATSGSGTATAGVATAAGAAGAAVPAGLVTITGTPEPGAPGWPGIIVEAGFLPAAPGLAGTALILGSGPGLGTCTLGPATAWTALNQYLPDGTPIAQSASITRSSTRQQGPLITYQAGTCTVTLTNSDARFSPENLAGPYVTGGVTQVRPMVPIRVRATWAGTTYDLFSGYVRSWTPPTAQNGPDYDYTVADAQDAMCVLEGVTLPASATAQGAGELSGARVARILAAAGWYDVAQALSDIDPGRSALQGTGFGDTALSLLQLTADSEAGEVYVNGSGAVVFRDRYAPQADSRSNTVQAVFGDSPGTGHAAGTELAYEEITRPDDDTTMANDIQAAIAGSSNVAEAKDAASIARFLFPRSYARSDLLLQADSDAANWAQYVLAISRSDEARFDSLTVHADAAPDTLFPQALGREIGDRIQVWRRPPGMAAIVRDCLISSISHEITVDSWMTTWGLRDASKYGSFFTLDNATLGRLDNNSLAF
jgi:hypothetical protein